MSCSSCIQNVFLTGEFSTIWKGNDIIFEIYDTKNGYTQDYDSTYIIVKTINDMEICRFQLNSVFAEAGYFTRGYILHIKQESHGKFYICIGIQEEDGKKIRNLIFNRNTLFLKDDDDYVYKKIMSDNYIISQIS